MALIGQGTNAALGATDYSGAANSAWQLANSNSNAIGHLAGSFTDAAKGIIEDQKKKKDLVKVSADKLDAAITLGLDQNGYLASARDKLKDEQRPLSERAGLGASIDDLVNMGVKKLQMDTSNRQQDRQFGLEDRRVTASEKANDQDIAAGQFKLSQAQQDQADQTQYAQFAGPSLINSLLDQTTQMERAGQKPLISSAQLSAALQMSPSQQMKAADLAMAGLPKDAKREFRDIPITINGQPGSATAAYDDKTGSFKIVPVSNWETISAPVTHYSKGSDAGGPDESQDSWTNKGYSSTGKNLTPGIAAVNTDVYPLGTVFKDADSGEVFIAGDRHGNKDPRTIDIYQNPENYTRERERRNLLIVGQEKSVGSTPAEIRAQLSKYYVPQQGVTAGAVKSEGKQQTPLDIQEQQMRVQRMAGEISGQQQSQTQAARDLQMAKDQKIDAANHSIQLVDQLLQHPGFTSAVGFDWVPFSISGGDKAGAEALLKQIKSRTFLDGISAMKGMGSLSDAEGAKIDSAMARLDAKSSEKDFKQAADELKYTLAEAIRRSGGRVWANPTQAPNDPKEAADAIFNRFR